MNVIFDGILMPEERIPDWIDMLQFAEEIKHHPIPERAISRISRFPEAACIDRE